jgi:hypothetical protein
MPRGASKKREREYKELVNKFEHHGRYKGREKEVASRIVNKQRGQYGETKGEKQKQKHGRSPERNLPIGDYQEKTVPEITRDLQGCSKKQIEKLRHYEQDHKNRKTMMEQFDRALGK